jgi:hypothetical protein
MKMNETEKLKSVIENTTITIETENSYDLAIQHDAESNRIFIGEVELNYNEVEKVMNILEVFKSFLNKTEKKQENS